MGEKLMVSVHHAQNARETKTVNWVLIGYWKNLPENINEKDNVPNLQKAHDNLQAK